MRVKEKGCKRQKDREKEREKQIGEERKRNKD